jgi:two-component system, OmpR family, response regulator ResD
MGKTGTDRDRNPRPRSSGARRPGATGRRHRALILLVEDDPHELEMYSDVLWYNGFDLIQSGDGEEAVAKALEHVPDLILVDLLLPGMNGIEVCRRIKADPRTAHVPVVALTAQSEEEFGLLAGNAGCQQFLEKPISPVDVLKLAEQLVGRPPPAGEDRPE